MTRFNNELDLQGLDEIFADNEEIDRDIEQKKIDFKTDVDYNDELEALKSNIHNANQLLVKIQDEMNNGNFSARLAEVASTVINSITQAAKEIMSDKNYEDYMEVRRDLVKLKAKEIEIKRDKNIRPSVQNNVLVTSREELLKMLGEKKQKQIE